MVTPPGPSGNAELGSPVFCCGRVPVTVDSIIPHGCRRRCRMPHLFSGGAGVGLYEIKRAEVDRSRRVTLLGTDRSPALAVDPGAACGHFCPPKRSPMSFRAWLRLAFVR